MKKSMSQRRVPRKIGADDDEEEREFSRSIVYDFFSQAEQTFQKMDDSL